MNTPAIAVLPFLNITSDPENEYFSDGMTEEIINALARIKSLKVISRTSSFFFKNKNIPLKEIAGQLNVNVVLEGSVRIAGENIRITAQLIQAEDDSHFWSETWNRKLENIFEIQDEISIHIAEKLREQFGHLEINDHLVPRQTESLDAYEYSLKARYYFNKWNPVDVKKAIELFEKAIEIDPSHTESYVGLADAYSFMATTEFMPRSEAWAKSVEFTHKAYSINPENAGVHYLLANLSFFTDCDFPEAARHTFRSLELKPSYPEAQQYMAFLYILSGEMEKARHHLQLALGIDPLNQETLFYKAYFYYRTHEYKNSIDLLEELLSKNPKNIPAFIVRTYCLLKLGDYGNVLSILEKAPEDIIIPDEHLGIQCLSYILQEDKKNTELCLARLRKEAEKPMSFQAHSYLFLAYVNLGMYNEAFAWMEESLERKSSIFLLSFSDPLAKPLREDSRYAIFHKKLYPEIFPSIHATEAKSQLLDEKTAGEFSNTLLEFIKHGQPFLNPNLTLRSLAEQVGIHPNQLSWLLNEKIGRNFNEFINHYRVEYFKVLARDPSNSHISLVGLAYESGFNSKTVFNTFFKKETGMTPSEFLKKNF